MLPLSEYVEWPDDAQPVQVAGKKPFKFVARPFERIDATSYSQAQRIIDVNLRHVVIQSALISRLAAEHGNDNAVAENSSGIGNKVDVMVRVGEEFCYYEVKTAGSARACIREALGQLMEYAYWPSAQLATKLVLVGESPLDPQARQYLAGLRLQFSLPIYYEQQKVVYGTVAADARPQPGRSPTFCIPLCRIATPF